MKRIFYICGVALAILTITSCDRQSSKSIDYSDDAILVKTYQVPGDGPHQYINFGYGGAHYPECKYCAEKMKQYDFHLKDASNFSIRCEEELSDELIYNMRVYLKEITLKEVVSNPNFKECLMDSFSLPQIKINYSNNL